MQHRFALRAGRPRRYGQAIVPVTVGALPSWKLAVAAYGREAGHFFGSSISPTAVLTACLTALRPRLTVLVVVTQCVPPTEKVSDTTEASGPPGTVGIGGTLTEIFSPNGAPAGVRVPGNVRVSAIGVLPLAQTS